ncbi:zinc finger protein 501-like isoform X1 [Cimex lectularius]|uniref:C2H2-type domain-containing protein n=2 Tax=Cimex lectularius TaxID=79782 RepID=A0A8I6RYR4_CIMLE|nr:zinc finger protein 501-like isoform X1 [Cimex lectularius]
MENPLTLDGSPSKNGKEEVPASSFLGGFPANSSKNDAMAANALKMSPEELNTLFCHEVFGPLKSGHDCTICGKSFPYRYQLIVHARYHTLPNETEGGNDKDWGLLGKSLELKDEPGTVSNLLAGALLGGRAPSTPETATKPHVCNLCGRGFTRKEHLTNHMNKHTGKGLNPHECHLCPKRFSRKDHLDSHLRAHDSDFKCHVCLKSFSRKEHLVAHVQWHTGASPHRCNHCRKSFTRREHLLAHVRQHTGESPHVCRFCAKSFTRREHVVNHERSHTGETPFKCSVCPRAFSRRDHLVVHTRQHTGETPYKCTECGKSFARREHLVNHTRQHTGESPYKCHFCPKSFTRRDHLANHIRHHTPQHSVPSQSSLSQLQAHQPGEAHQQVQGQLIVPHPPPPIHSQNNYTCHVCLKSFPLKGNLLFHMNTHTLGY